MLKTLIFGAVLLCNGIQTETKPEAKQEPKTAEQQQAEHIDELAKKLAEKGKLFAENAKLAMPKQFQRRAPKWILPTLNIRGEDLESGTVGFVEDIVVVDEVINETKFRATIYVRRRNATEINAIIDNHPTKGYSDGKKVTLNGIMEVGTEKTVTGETLLVFTHRDVPMEKIKAAINSKTPGKK